MDKETAYPIKVSQAAHAAPQRLLNGQASASGDNAAIYVGNAQPIDLEKSAHIIANLKGRFVQVAGTMSDSLWDALETINNNPRQAISQIHHIAHSLAGNAETFGFPVLGRAAYDLSEVILCQEKIANDNIDVREIADLSNHLLEMLRTVSTTVTH